MSAHLMILPVVVPLLVGALLLWVEPRYPRFARWLSGASVLALLVLAMVLLRQADSGQVSAYLLGNWQAPFGIALALDRLSALMLLLTASVATLAWIYSRAREVKQGAHFDALFQFQLMGLNGAFLTADVFNLFVFFEVLLIASYGLLLRGAWSLALPAGALAVDAVLQWLSEGTVLLQEIKALRSPALARTELK